MLIPDFLKRKQAKSRITCVTCYDYPYAKLLAQTEVDFLLVGDSVAMVVHGHASTLLADIDMMCLHTSAVARGVSEAGGKFIVTDMPFLEHRKSQAAAVDAAQRLLRAGANAIKIEGADGNLATIKLLTEAGVPVMGHVGLTPQFVNVFGGFKVQGRETAAAKKIVEDAIALEEAGVFSIVAEGVPSAVGKAVTEAVTVPIIGIGAGIDVDGQVLVLQDMLGFNPKPARFVRVFADATVPTLEGIRAFDAAVKAGTFPSEKESYN
jgi:3-methyl-2-oxobutanoate hydroxymethyltransferase